METEILRRDTITQLPLWPVVRPLSNQAELEELQAAADRDKHQVLFPTHIVRKAGEIVGYASVCAAPIMFVWLDSKRVKTRETLMLLALGENLARAKGVQILLMPCAEDSPFSPLMTGMGFEIVGKTVLYAKKM